MPRLPRIYFHGALYCVRTQADHNLSLFKEDEDKKEYLRLLHEYKEEYGYKLYAFLLMEKELYLVIEPSKEANISRIMHSIHSRYTKYFNNRYDRKGHLFQERFKAVVVEKKRYLVKLSRYLHYLPVKNGLVEKPSEYKWSSHSYYINNSDVPVLIDMDTEDIINSFSPHKKKAKKLYSKYVREEDGDGLDSFEKELLNARILGSEDYKKVVKRERKEYKKSKKKNRKSHNSAEESEDFLKKTNSFLSKEKIKKIAHSKVRVFEFVILILAIFLFGLNGYLFINNIKIKNSLQHARKRLEKSDYEKSINEVIKEAKEEIRKDLKEKYRADIVSYRVMKENIELEKKDKNSSNGI